MAMNFSRWFLIREVISRAKTGTLTLQVGPNYHYWYLEKGILVYACSTVPDCTFREFLRQQRVVDDALILQHASEVDEENTLGAVLIQRRAITAQQLQTLLHQHWISLSESLFDTGTHLFWSDQSRNLKPKTMDAGISFYQVLLSIDRSCIEIRTAAQFAEEFPARYRLSKITIAASHLLDGEKRLLTYLNRGASIEEIKKDPGYDLLTCYRALFLLWLSGFLEEMHARATECSVPKPTVMQRLRSIPAEWIFPFVAGVLLGVFLAPSSAPPDPPTPKQLHHVLDHPAWEERKN